ncbi:hypothetical protein ACKI2N_031875 [Cupriavidus sp. 30B13]|uniref:hypothetical protein n=1 Tax=Cupriavidus sp. 30B13 TaxID=3384241 RepID=UPI003CEEBEB7
MGQRPAKRQLVGAYLPKLDREAMQAFADHEVEEHRSYRLDDITRGNEKNPARVEERTKEIRDELLAGLQDGAYFEVPVTGDSAEFRADEFICWRVRTSV